MFDFLKQKFAIGTAYRTLLDQTKSMDIIELNFWNDNFWGQCNCKKCTASNIIGENNLGKLLMKIRDKE